MIPGRKLNRERLKYLQRRVSRAVRGSRNRRKKVASLSKEWQRVREREKGYRHELSAALVAKSNHLVAEDLRVQNMMKSASGTAEQPGKGVAAKSGLNRAIAEQGWAQLVEMLTYKAEKAGGKLVLVNPAHTSQACSGCGGLPSEKLTLGVRQYRCGHCGYEDDRDVNAARNVLAKAGGKRATGLPATRLAA